MRALLRRGKLFPFLSFILILSSPGLFGQEGFRLSDYKNPDYHWKRLDLDFGLAGSSGFYKSKMDYTLNGHDSTRSSASNLGGDVSATYYNIRNSRHYQGTQAMTAGGSGSFTAQADNEAGFGYDQDESQKQRSGNGNLWLSSSNRFYNDRLMFLEADLELGAYYGYNGFEYEYDPLLYPSQVDRQYINYGAESALSLLAGIGRIEDVQDARLAVYILEDLQKAGDVKGTLSSEQVVEMAEFITELKNQRYFDSRIRKIEEITALDSFMTARGYRAAPTASYFTLLNDNWDYAAGPVRSTGYRFSFGARPSLDWGYNGSRSSYYLVNEFNEPDLRKDTSTAVRLTRGLDGVVMFRWEKPSSLYWQHSLWSNASYALYHERVVSSYHSITVTEDTTLNITPNLRFNAGYTLGYYPNSRTEITLTAYGGLMRYWGTREQYSVEQDYDRFYYNGGMVLNCYYYFSERLRLTVTAQSQYFHSREEYTYNGSSTEITDHSLQSSFSAGLLYSIF